MTQTSQAAPTHKEFAQALEDLGLTATSDQTRALAHYVSLLARWNTRINLVGFKTWHDILVNLVADSFYLARWLGELNLPEDPLSLDLGAGAGIPGVPLRILWPVGRYVLVEPREKRAVFLRTAVAELGLERTQVRQERAEQTFQTYPFTELFISRAFRPWPDLLSLASGRLSPGGRVIIMANEAPPADPGQGFVLESVQEYQSAGRPRYFWSLAPMSMPR